MTSQSGFKSDSSWVILSPLEARIKNKIETIGIPLRDWDISIYRGILTGYNEAFIIDQKTRDQLIKASPKSAEIIRPIISGKDIKRYKYHWQDTWIINAHNGVKSKNIPRVDLAADYPVILNYLQGFSPRIKERSDQGDHWSNLRNCAYMEAFEKPKIVWGNLALNTQFTFIKEPFIVNNPSNFFNTDNFYLLGLLNSRLVDFYIKQLGVTRNGGYFEYKPMFVEQVPIPKVSDEVEKCFAAIVDDLLNENGDAMELEHKINSMVFELFDLTEEEIIHIYNIAVPTNSTSSSDKENS
ncbi:MAG: TaqI-like C-terminal specificity domain-containing protein [Mucilaginibacter sp.]